MSLEDARSFIAKVKADPTLAAGLVRPKDIADKPVKRKGVVFTIAES